MTQRLNCLLLFAVCLSALRAVAGGPLVVGGPNFGVEGQPFTWDLASFPIKYRVDGGPMSTSSGKVVIDNATGLARVQKMFGNWQVVGTTNISYSYAGPIQSAGSFTGGDVATVTQFNDVIGSCRSGTQSPIVFDAGGIIVAGLGLDPDIIGFAGQCKLDTSSGHIVTAFALLNGQFQDGVNSPPNYEITSDQFDQAITHEFGHFSGLDHSQINALVMVQESVDNCDSDSLTGMPIMFPILYCQARSTAGLPVLSPDDMAWISKLYPATNYSSTYGTISGLILFSDGITHAQGVNVIARRVDDPATSQNESLQFAVSVVSGYRFTGNPGQAVTGDNTNGDSTGSRSPLLIGAYEIPVPAGTYTVEVESINSGFTLSSSVGPLDPPIFIPGRAEFWNLQESAFDDYSARDPITVAPGQTVNGINIILNGTEPRFDQFEDGGAKLDYPRQLLRPVRQKEESVA